MEKALMWDLHTQSYRICTSQVRNKLKGWKKQGKPQQMPQTEFFPPLPLVTQTLTHKTRWETSFCLRWWICSKCYGSPTYNSLLEGAGGASPGMSLISLLLGLTIWKIT
jgi:hypothetical protein